MTLQEYAEAIRKGDDPLAVLRVAVSEAESSALERAAQDFDKRANCAIDNAQAYRFRVVAKDIRALIPPAAAPAASAEEIRAAQGTAVYPADLDDAARMHAAYAAAAEAAAPAAETGKAQGTEAGGCFGQFCPRCPCVVATYQEKCPACGEKMWTPREWSNALAPLVAARRRLHVLRASVALESAATKVDREWLKAVGGELEKCHLEVHSVATAFAAFAAPPEREGK